jgi:hypothetical protein
MTGIIVIDRVEQQAMALIEGATHGS